MSDGLPRDQAKREDEKCTGAGKLGPLALVMEALLAKISKIVPIKLAGAVLGAPGGGKPSGGPVPVTGLPAAPAVLMLPIGARKRGFLSPDRCECAGCHLMRAIARRN